MRFCPTNSPSLNQMPHSPALRPRPAIHPLSFKNTELRAHQRILAALKQPQPRSRPQCPDNAHIANPTHIKVAMWQSDPPLRQSPRPTHQTRFMQIYPRQRLTSPSHDVAFSLHSRRDTSAEILPAPPAPFVFSSLFPTPNMQRCPLSASPFLGLILFSPRSLR